MYKAVVFDFFDVIRTDAYKAWLQRYGFNLEGDFLEAVKQLDHGMITIPAFIQRLSDTTGHSVARITKEMDESDALDYEVIEILRSLKPRYKTGLLSNAPSDFLRGLLKKHNIEKDFDEIIISSEVGMIKPQPEIFHCLLDALALQPNEVLFIDDNPANIAGAEAVGITGILYTGSQTLRQALSALRMIP